MIEIITSILSKRNFIEIGSSSVSDDGNHPNGVECYYLPTEIATTNTVIREVVQSEFNNIIL